MSEDNEKDSFSTSEPSPSIEPPTSPTPSTQDRKIPRLQFSKTSYTGTSAADAFVLVHNAIRRELIDGLYIKEYLRTYLPTLETDAVFHFREWFGDFKDLLILTLTMEKDVLLPYAKSKLPTLTSSGKIDVLEKGNTKLQADFSDLAVLFRNTPGSTYKESFPQLDDVMHNLTHKCSLHLRVVDEAIVTPLAAIPVEKNLPADKIEEQLVNIALKSMTVSIIALPWLIRCLKTNMARKKWIDFFLNKQTRDNYPEMEAKYFSTHHAYFRYFVEKADKQDSSNLLSSDNSVSLVYEREMFPEFSIVDPVVEDRSRAPNSIAPLLSPRGTHPASLGERATSAMKMRQMTSPRKSDATPPPLLFGQKKRSSIRSPRVSIIIPSNNDDDEEQPSSSFRQRGKSNAAAGPRSSNARSPNARSPNAGGPRSPNTGGPRSPNAGGPRSPRGGEGGGDFHGKDGGVNGPISMTNRGKSNANPRSPRIYNGDPSAASFGLRGKSNAVPRTSKSYNDDGPDEGRVEITPQKGLRKLGISQQRLSNTNSPTPLIVESEISQTTNAAKTKLGSLSKRLSNIISPRARTDSSSPHFHAPS